MKSIYTIFQEHKNPVSKNLTVSDTKSRYKNKWVVLDGIKFQSQGEAYHWLGLKDQMNRGEFREVKRQVKFPLVVNGIEVANYVADFVTMDYSNCIQVIDYKSRFTATLALYQMKRKLMNAIYGVVIVEAGKK